MLCVHYGKLPSPYRRFKKLVHLHKVSFRSKLIVSKYIYLVYLTIFKVSILLVFFCLTISWDCAIKFSFYKHFNEGLIMYRHKYSSMIGLFNFLYFATLRNMFFLSLLKPVMLSIQLLSLIFNMSVKSSNPLFSVCALLIPILRFWWEK